MTDAELDNAEIWPEDRFFDTISELVMLHSPSGVEGEVNDYLLNHLTALGVEHWQDAADNVVVRIAAAGERESESSGEGAIGKGAITIPPISSL
ncbi:MAG: hypothetical protein AAGL17_01300 [Cyanobacteria bacterium J06576_12]